MAVLGPDNLLVNAQKIRLLTNSGADNYLQLFNVKTHFGRPEDRRTLTDGSVQYFYGSGEHFFEAIIFGTTDQISAFNALTELSTEGNATSNEYRIITTAKDGTTATITVQAHLRDFDINTPEVGFLEFRCYFRILTDTITVS